MVMPGAAYVGRRVGQRQAKLREGGTCPLKPGVPELRHRCRDDAVTDECPLILEGREHGGGVAAQRLECVGEAAARFPIGPRETAQPGVGVHQVVPLLAPDLHHEACERLA